MHKFKKYFLGLILISLLFSCAALKKPDPRLHIPPPQPEPYVLDKDQQTPRIKLSEQRKIILHYAIESLGIPYTWGGQSPETGFDCSGLSSYTHKKAGIIIPRTAQAQSKKGQFVEKQNLQAGDLVFFKSPQKKSGFHVGIYIGKGLLIHAPGKGSPVTLAELKNPYFKKYYIGSRSYL